MANPFNGSKRGVRGGGRGNPNRPSRKPFTEPKPKQSSAAKFAEQVSPYWACADVAETKQDHVIPRKSVTSKHHLGLFTPDIETETRKARQLDKRTGQMVETTDQRRVWKSDDSLLRLGKPDRFGEDEGTTFIR